MIVSPALAEANNGNWQTARRWQLFLQPHFDVRVVRQWPDGNPAESDAVMLALHARRSAESIVAWKRFQEEKSALEHIKPAHSAIENIALPPSNGLAVVLTGTDLYRDIHTDPTAQQSLQSAQALVVLQERGVDALPAKLRPKTRVIFQSVSARQSPLKTRAHLRVVMVGHLRHEKSPQTLWQAAALLTAQDRICIDHIGAPLDAALGQQAQAVACALPHYRWLGSLPHAQVRQRIARAHGLVIASQMEGGAHVVMEAVRSGTPVLASKIDGNVGMLGADYAGYFAWADAEGLATLLRRCRAGWVRKEAASGLAAKSTQSPESAQSPESSEAPGSPELAHDPLYATLQAQCAARAHLFAPQTERTALLALVADLQNRG